MLALLTLVVVKMVANTPISLVMTTTNVPKTPAVLHMAAITIVSFAMIMINVPEIVVAQKLDAALMK